jgi:hypothetical protein
MSTNPRRLSISYLLNPTSDSVGCVVIDATSSPHYITLEAPFQSQGKKSRVIDSDFPRGS